MHAALVLLQRQPRGIPAVGEEPRRAVDRQAAVVAQVGTGPTILLVLVPQRVPVARERRLRPRRGAVQQDNRQQCRDRAPSPTHEPFPFIRRPGSSDPGGPRDDAPILPRICQGFAGPRPAPRHLTTTAWRILSMRFPHEEQPCDARDLQQPPAWAASSSAVDRRRRRSGTGDLHARPAHAVGRARPAGHVDQRKRAERAVRTAARVRHASDAHRRRVRVAPRHPAEADRLRQRRLRSRDGRSIERRSGGLGHVAAAALARTRARRRAARRW